MIVAGHARHGSIKDAFNRTTCGARAVSKAVVPPSLFALCDCVEAFRRACAGSTQDGQ